MNKELLAKYYFYKETLFYYEKFKPKRLQTETSVFKSSVFANFNKYADFVLKTIKKDVVRFCYPEDITTDWEFGQHIAAECAPLECSKTLYKLKFGFDRPDFNEQNLREMLVGYLCPLEKITTILPNCVKSVLTNKNLNKQKQYAFFISFFVNFYFQKLKNIE